MDLTSCSNCGVVLDKDRLSFPPDIYDLAGSVDESLGMYSDYESRWVPYVSCPVCQKPITRYSR